MTLAADGDDREGLERRSVRAGAWVLASRLFLRSAGLVKNIALARILVPDDFGLFGLVVAVLSAAESFTVTGVQAALVQRRGDVSASLDTGWTLLVARGALLAALLALAAPWVADFFDEPRAAPLLRALAMLPLLRALQSIGLVQLQRALEHRLLFRLQLVSTIAELVTTICLALWLRSAWALATGLLVGAAAQAILSYLVHPHRPRLSIDRAEATALSRFGRWVFLGHVLMFAATRADNVVIGKMLGLEALGLYVLALGIADALSIEITRMVNEVAFPAYARLQGDLPRLRAGYLASLQLVSSISLPVAAVAAVSADALVTTLLGPRWSPAGGLLPALLLAGTLRSLSSVGQAVFRGVGRPELSLVVQAAAAVSLFAAMIPAIGLGYGLSGVAASVLLSAVLVAPVQAWLVRRTIDLELAEQLRALLPATCLAALSALPALIAVEVETSPVVTVALAAAGAGAVWAVAATVQHLAFSSGPVSLLLVAVRRGRRERPNVGGRGAGAVEEAGA